MRERYIKRVIIIISYVAIARMSSYNNILLMLNGNIFSMLNGARPPRALSCKREEEGGGEEAGMAGI